MARNPNTKAEATITLNGKQAEQVLKKLKDQADDLKLKIEAAKKANNPKEVARLEQELRNVRNTLNNVQRATYDYSNVLKNINGSSIKDLEKTARQLKSEIRQLTPATTEFVQKSAQLEQVKQRLKQLNNTTVQHASTWERVTNAFNKYFGVVTAFIGSVTGLGLLFRSLSEKAAQMDDTFADVMKTTGLTRKEVLGLNEDFKKLDTRTSRQRLNELARDAGKLGLEAKKDVLDFVDAGNQINVALGADLGEDAIKQIGKMTDVFQSSTKHLEGLDLKGKMLAVASVVNELGMSSTAAERYLVSFAGRLGGVSKQANIAINDIMGFASALDQDMQRVEMSATAFQKFIMKLMGEPAQFAEIAGLEVKEFTKLLETDTNQAIKTVLKALNEKGGFQQLIPIFKDMGLDGARAVGVLSAMAGSMHKIEEAQTIANKALIEGVSVTKEYSIKNENHMAKLEKARKRFKDMAIELGEKLNPAMLKFTNTSSLMVKGLSVLFGFLGKYGAIILKLSAIIGAYIVAIKLKYLWTAKLQKANLLLLATEKLKQFWFTVSTAATQIYAAATMLLTGNVKGATQAMRIFFNVLKTNPIGFIAAAITAAGLALYTFIKNSRKAADDYKVITSDIVNAQKQYIESVQEEKQDINSLINAITDVNTSQSTRLKLINELKDKYPDFLKFIDAEKASNDELLLVLKRVNDTYTDRFKVAAIKGRADAYTEKIVQMETRRFEIQEELDALRRKSHLAETADYKKKWADLNREEEELKKQVDSYTKKVEEFNASARKMQADIDSSFTLDGLRQQVEQYEKLIEAAQNRLDKARFDDEKDYYAAEIESLKVKKKLLDEQLEVAIKLNEAEKNKNAGGEDFEDEPDFSDKDRDKLLKKRLTALQDEWDREKLLVMQQYEQGKMNYIKYKEELAAIDELYNTRKADIEEQFNQSGAGSLQKALSHKIKALKKQEQEDAKILEEREKHLQALKKIEDDYQRSLQDKEGRELLAIRQKYDKAIDLSKQAANRKLITEDESLSEIADLVIKRDKELAAKREAQRLKRDEKQTEQQQKLADERNRLLESLNLRSITEMWSDEINQLNYYHQLKLITEDEFQQAMLAIADKYRDLQQERDAAALERKLKNIKKVLAAAESITKIGSNMIGAINEAETERMNAQYEARLTAAGDNAEERQKIEEERAKAEIEIQKKYADANFALQVLQLSVSGTLAGMEAYKALAGIPVVGPALGAAAAAAVGITTIAQIAKAKAERDKIKSVSYHGSGRTGSSTKERVIVSGLEDGGFFEVERAQDGKTFNAQYNPLQRGFIGTPTVLVGENGSEFVASNTAVNNPTVKPVLDIINTAQKSGSVATLNLPAVIKATQIQGYQKGGYFGKPAENRQTTPDTQNTPQLAADTELKNTLTQIKELLLYLKTFGVKAPVVLSEIEKQQALVKKSDNLGNRI